MWPIQNSINSNLKALSAGSHVLLIPDLNLERQKEFIFGIVLHLHHIYDKFEYQGHLMENANFAT